MFFPSDNGLLAFYPDSIEDNPIIPPIVITDFKLFNESVRMGKKSPIQTSISGVNEITLPYNQNFLSLEFAALNYLHPEKNRYKYKMEGLDPDWITAGTRRFADYPDLKPGKYTFRVIGSNNNGGWNMEGTSLQISILPPWWATYYAYLIYGFLIVLLIIGYGRLRIRQVRKQKILLKDEVRKRTQQIEANQEEIESQKKLLEVQNRKILEANQMKTRFFNNVSHEFRTPLTLIQGPAKDLQTHAKLNKKEHGKLQMISQNAGRLLALVNQVLDIAKLDNGRMKLKLVNGDIMQSLRNIVGSFTSMAETRGILYNRFIPIGKYNTWFDFNVLEKIVVNLLSNAFKFTPEAGEITFRARWFHGETIESPDQIEFSVSDQGPGIPKNSIDKIFDRFYQIEDAGLQSSAGTGIGLSLVRDLVNLNHGKIDVKSEIGEGSTFTITLPLGKDHLTKDEYVTESEEPKFDSISVESKETVSYAFRQTQSTHKNKNETENPIVLIVEDNPDIRRYISESLEDMYQVIEAVNGDSGLIKTKKNIPDLVITDLIMPKTDGIELCREIKSDERTSHIPIIMLTAKASLDEKLTGLETGADDYLSKPFHMEELITRITNLIDQRKKLRERFSREITLEPRDISVTSLDEAFLNRAIATVESHLSDDAFDINKFQDEMHMSHSTLFRKLQALTNLSPTGFIRNIRLKRAAQLLREHYGNIAKVSYEVGFNNPAYFSKCFKSLFGMSPVDYLNKSLKEV
jgi:signal transduction histidine kinase/DNA-binding response OmpR family regulator